MTLPRVMIVDDHRAVVEGLVQLLGGRFDIVDTIADGRHVLDGVARRNPAVVLLDISIPGANGIQVLRQLRKSRPELKVIVLTMYADASLAVEALRMGASGYVLKSGGEELLTALDAVLGGGTYLARDLRGESASLMAGVTDPRQIELSPRQREVLQLMVLGRRMTEIASVLNLSVGSVNAVKRELMQLLNVDSTAQLVEYAEEHRLVAGP
jgi:DNA-binding NarL/FixJ family response regulator